MASGQTKRVLVYGGKGALGSAVINFFKKHGVFVINVDINGNESADLNVQVDSALSWSGQAEHVEREVGQALGAEHQLDAVLCVAGGWAGGNASAKDFVANSELVWKQSVWSSTIAAHLSSKFLRSGGLLQLTGAAAAQHGTPGMIGYGAAKAAVHQMTKSLASKGSGLPDGASVLAILPVTLDTAMNRKWMPKSDHSKWTPLEFVAEKLYDWTYPSDGAFERPPSGSLLLLTTSDGHTQVETVSSQTE